MPILQTPNLTRKFGALTAVDSFTIQVEEGEVFPQMLSVDGALMLFEP